ncbi:ABC transporter permease [Ezakiella peruensis]|uniref:ABC transporter permease n=1 Tax=Ezakiella peruensis TaxID=1464038 RepID=UPI000C1B2888|nr:ABC transporter permease subunit [Ezakiella peruensis]
MTKNKKRLIGGGFLIIFWIVLAAIIDDQVFFPSFASLIKRVIEFFADGRILLAIGITCGRVLLAMGLSVAFASVIGYLAYKFDLEDYFAPLISLVRAIPVVSMILIALFFTNKNTLSVLVIFFVSFPIVYENVLNGLKSIPKEKLELAEIFDLKAGKIFKYIELPAIINSILFALTIAFGLAFKAGATAEVIAGAAGGLGDLLYMAKLSFEMADLLAVTFIIIILSFIFESLTKYLYKIYGEKYA